MPFWKRMLMPVSDHPWVDAEAQRRPPEWYSYNYGSVRPPALAYAPVRPCLHHCLVRIEDA